MRELWGPTPAQVRYERDPASPWPSSAADARRPACHRNRLAWALGNSLALLTMLLIWVHDLWLRSGAQLTQAQQMQITMEVIGTCTYLAVTCTVWWFGVRPAARK